MDEVGCTLIALLSHRDASSSVLKPEIAEGQGTVFFTFAASQHGMRSPLRSGHFSTSGNGMD